MAVAFTLAMDLKIVAQIKVVEIDRIFPFEWSEPGPSETITEQDNLSFIRHPFPVTPLQNDEFLLLGDTVYFTQLTQTNLIHLPVQVIPPEQLHLSSNNIGLIGYTAEQLIHLAAKFPKQILIGNTLDSQPPSDDFLKVQITFIDGRTFQVFLRHSSRAGCPPPLEYLFRSISYSGRYVPTVKESAYTTSVTRISPISGTMTLPSFSLDDIRTAVIAERLFPPDVIEITSSCRILNIDFPLSVLKADTGPEEKESFFCDLVNIRAQAHKVSYYNGQVYLLNH